MPRPYVVSTVHSSRVRSAEDRDEIRRLTASHGPAHRRRARRSSRRSATRSGSTRHSGPPVELIYNGVDLERYDHQEPCCTLREEYGLPDDALLAGVVARLEPEKGHATLLEAWPAVVQRCPRRTCWSSAKGAVARRWPSRPRPSASPPPGRVHRSPRRRAGGHRGARRGRAAVLPRGPGPLDPRGDGALAAGRRVTGRRHPRGHHRRRVRPARAAPRPRGARGRNHDASCATTRWPTCSPAPATTWSTTASASS